MGDILFAGVRAVEDYVATHVLTCLVPAFLLAGAMVTFIDRNLVLEHLGQRANRIKSYSLASGASFLLAACSCTVIPVAGGLYFAGAGVSAAFILLWVAPSANILALVYTGSILGSGMMASRVLASLVMALVVGTAMGFAFRDRSPGESGDAGREQVRGSLIAGRELIIIGLILLSLLLPNYLVRNRPYILKVSVWLACTLAMALYAWKRIPRERIWSWAKETWWFVRIIFPLLLGGVFLVGVIGKLLPEELIRQWLGGNGILASFFGTMIGAVTYFATMTEAPFVHTLMGLGMGKGPALALLLTGPGVSLPNWLAIARVFGVKKATVYVPVIVVSGTLMGWFFGNFIF
ncbi:MAG: permease [Deltaproteobacteria bacterium]|nr:permease [Deltaproteobacteria bacterium]NIS77698.1 permease [Deltaproteobacteria bacterium]